KIPARPVLSIVLTQKSTIGPVMSAKRIGCSIEETGILEADGTKLAALSMRRLNHPVYRNRVLQVCADGALVALSYYLAFRLRFLDRSDLPHRYWVLFVQSVGFVVACKLIVFAAFGLYQKW